MVVSPGLRRFVTPLFDKVVYASTAYVELKSTVNDFAPALVDFSAEPAGEADGRLREALALIRPWQLPGARLVRVGGDRDGGYVMLADEITTATAAISIGVGRDVSWDASIAALGLPVAMFDPTVRRPPTKVPGAVFHRVGVAGIASPDGLYRPLRDLVRLSGFDAGAQLLLKMDVEGAEWPALSALDPGELSGYRQIVTELHDFSRLADPDAGGPVLAALRALNRTHLPIHVHANNYSRLVRFDRYWFPDTVEVSFVRRDLAGGAQPAARVASPFDVPSDPRVAEISLEGLLTMPADGPVTLPANLPDHPDRAAATRP
jgi:hypothetical protein